MRAVVMGPTEEVRILLEAGVDVNVKSRDGNTALILQEKGFTLRSLTCSEMMVPLNNEVTGKKQDTFL